MKKLFFSSMCALVLFMSAFFANGQGALLPDAGLTPESSLYFLDKIGEAIHEFFTFNPEAKARLQISFAAERIAEIKIILETKGVEAKGLDVAQSRLQANLAKAAAIVVNQKSKGKDVSMLAGELGDVFKLHKEELLRILKTEEGALERKEEALESELKAAHRAGDTLKIETLAAQLGEVKAQLELLELKKEDIEDILEAEEEKIEEEMELERKAQKAIRKAEEEKAEVIAEALEEGITLPVDAFVEFDALLAQAQSAFDTGDFADARIFAKQAKDALESVEGKADVLKEEKEAQEDIEEELKDEAERALEETEEETRRKEQKDEDGDEENEFTIPVDKDIPGIQIVTYFDSGFAPKSINIKKGDIIRFENESSRGMWVASNFHPTHTIYSAFDEKESVPKGETWDFTFDKKGSWNYHNHASAGHGGTIVVVE